MTEQLEMVPQNTIRIETALSRFPVHKLARQRGGILAGDEDVSHSAIL